MGKTYLGASATCTVIHSRVPRFASFLTGNHRQEDIRNAGGNWKDQEVVRDDNWVSSRQPSDISAFNREMLALFAQAKSKAKTA